MGMEKTWFLEQIELQAKLLNNFLGSNKSNINQSGAGAPSPSGFFFFTNKCCFGLWAVGGFTTIGISRNLIITQDLHK